jgi:type II secretory pathway pseudopilin PulG
MASRPRTSSSISLPWERRGAWVRELFAGRRWKLLALFAVLALVLLLVGRSAQHRQRVHDTRAAMDEIHRAITAFRADVGRCPNTLDELQHPPRSGRRYLRHVPVDGWGRAFYVRCPGRYDPGGADVVSAGADGSFLVDDNIQ